MKKLIPFVLLLGIIACTSTSEESSENQTTAIPTGAYSGVIPCADCEGLYTQIIFSDSTAEVKRAYLGKPGTFSRKYQVNLSEGKVIALSSDTDSLFFTTDSTNQLVWLSPQRKRISGDLEDQYVLKPGLPEGRQINETDGSGVDFRGLGHEPFWSLDVRWAEEFRMIFPGDTINGILRNPNILGDTIVFIDKNENRDVIIRLWPEASLHPASGQLFPWRVSMVLNGERFQGLGDFFKGSIHPLSGRWILNNYRLNDTSEFKLKHPEITFNTAEMRCFGNDGCNQFNGRFDIEGNRITFGPLASTRMACQNLPDAEFNRLLSSGLIIDPEQSRIIAGDLDGEYLIFSRK